MKSTFVKTRLLVAVCAVLLFGGFLQPANAVLFDWDTVTWAPGSLSNSYDIDATNPGNDVTITITGSTDNFIHDYVQLNQDFQGGLATAENVLSVLVNLGNDAASITITVTFHYAFGVEDMEFTLFDVDRKQSGSFVDEIRTIKANFEGGADIAATSVTGSANNTVSGSGLGVTIVGTAQTPDTGTGSGDANATISFGTNALSEFSFVYGNNLDANNNPAQQGIGFYDFSFKKRIPEYHPALVASLMCGLFGTWWSLRQRLGAW